MKVFRVDTESLCAVNQAEVSHELLILIERELEDRSSAVSLEEIATAGLSEKQLSFVELMRQSAHDSSAQKTEKDLHNA